jgi:hypothetical protein
MTEAPSGRTPMTGQATGLEDRPPVSLQRHLLTVLGFACVGPAMGALILFALTIALQSAATSRHPGPSGDVVGGIVVLGYVFGFVPAVIAGTATCFTFGRVRRRLPRLLAAFGIGAASTLFFVAAGLAGKRHVDPDMWKLVAALICIGGFPAVLCAALFAPVAKRKKPSYSARRSSRAN